MKFSEFYKIITRPKEYTCKFCNATLPNIGDLVRYKGNSFQFNDLIYDLQYSRRDLNEITNIPPDWMILEYIYCPKCKNISITAYRPCTEERIPIYPKHSGKNFPDYIPEQIRKDYEEACLIMDLSPKASATLSRRCLQGIIRDFFNINEDTLYKEIEKAAQQPTITKQQHDALHALRKLGNIGAHPEKDVNVIVDVEPHEAATMIKLVEFFLTEWCIHRHEADELLSNIVSISDQKQAIKQAPPQKTP